MKNADWPVLLPIALILSASPAAAGPEDPVVRLAAGDVRGTIEQGVEVFRGIPYAAPPVGELRWRPPAPPEKLQGIRDATRFAPNCPGAFPADGAMAEDCLYLNVWTTSDRSAARKPVMVWIYGGGFRGGSAAQPLFDGRALAKAGVVLVTFGYRTGSLGFLALPELTGESPSHSSGNYGILDAIAALGWVRDNIADFGGDPDNVTIFGQSSGSETVNILTASPLAKGLFQRAIGESGSSLGVRAAPALAVAERAGRDFAVRVNAAGVAELRAAPWQAVLALDAEKFEPNIDGWVLPRAVAEIYRRGEQNDVPMLVGNTSQEFARPGEIAEQEFLHQLAMEYGSSAEVIRARLGESDPTSARWRLTNIEWGDYPASTWARLQADTGKAPIYRYLFDYAPPQRQPRIAAHGAEIPYVFGNHEADPAPAGARLSDLLRGYWTNFARSGDPNGQDLPMWRPEREAPTSYMVFTEAGAAQRAERSRPLIEALDAYRDTESGKD